MPERTNLIYQYDGSLDGLLCCIFESFLRNEEPLDILPADREQQSLWALHAVVTQPDRARRVWDALDHKISPLAREMVVRAFLTCLPHKELLILRFVRLGLQQGGKVTQQLGDETVMTLTRAIKSLWFEAHHFMGFLRFSENAGFLTAVISPKNQILPLVADHFINRYSQEDFLVYDDVHHMALVHRRDGQCGLMPMEDFSPPRPGAEEEYVRSLWQTFHTAIAISGRLNPRCQQTMCPKRFWKDMPEMPDPGPRLRRPRKLPVTFQSPRGESTSPGAPGRTETLDANHFSYQAPALEENPVLENALSSFPSQLDKPEPESHD